jgi:hypothetical protein
MVYGAVANTGDICSDDYSIRELSLELFEMLEDPTITTTDIAKFLAEFTDDPKEVLELLLANNGSDTLHTDNRRLTRKANLVKNKLNKTEEYKAKFSDFLQKKHLYTEGDNKNFIYSSKEESLLKKISCLLVKNSTGNNTISKLSKPSTTTKNEDNQKKLPFTSLTVIYPKDKLDDNYLKDKGFIVANNILHFAGNNSDKAKKERQSYEQYISTLIENKFHPAVVDDAKKCFTQELSKNDTTKNIVAINYSYMEECWSPDFKDGAPSEFTNNSGETQIVDYFEDARVYNVHVNIENQALLSELDQKAYDLYKQITELTDLKKEKQNKETELKINKYREERAKIRESIAKLLLNNDVAIRTTTKNGFVVDFIMPSNCNKTAESITNILTMCSIGLDYNNRKNKATHARFSCPNLRHLNTIRLSDEEAGVKMVQINSVNISKHGLTDKPLTRSRIDSESEGESEFEGEGAFEFDDINMNNIAIRFNKPFFIVVKDKQGAILSIVETNDPQGEEYQRVKNIKDDSSNDDDSLNYFW